MKHIIGTGDELHSDLLSSSLLAFQQWLVWVELTVFMLTHARKLEIGTRALGTPSTCTNHTYSCVCHLPLLFHETLNSPAGHRDWAFSVSKVLCSPRHKLTSVRKQSLGANSPTSVHYSNYEPKTGCRWLYWDSPIGFLGLILSNSPLWEQRKRTFRICIFQCGVSTYIQSLS